METLFKFQELPEDIKQVVREELEDRPRYLSEEFMDEFYTMRKFYNFFDTDYLYNIDEYDATCSFIFPNFEHGQEELTGNRLRTFLVNRYTKYLTKNKPYTGKQKKRYSNITADVDWYGLTGLYMDYEMFLPIKEFIEKPNNHDTFETLMEKAFNNFAANVQSEMLYRKTDEYLINFYDTLEVRFDKFGREYHQIDYKL